MKSFSQTFVNYHGSGNGYLDGTNKIVPEGRRSMKPTNNPFWKKTNRYFEQNRKINKIAN